MRAGSVVGRPVGRARRRAGRAGAALLAATALVGLVMVSDASALRAEPRTRARAAGSAAPARAAASPPPAVAPATAARATAPVPTNGATAATHVAGATTAASEAGRRPITDPLAWDDAAMLAEVRAWLATVPGVHSVALAAAGGGHTWIGEAAQPPAVGAPPAGAPAATTSTTTSTTSQAANQPSDQPANQPVDQQAQPSDQQAQPLTPPTVQTTVAAPASPPVLHAADRHHALSITKTFTAALVLRAVEAGTLSLDQLAPDVPGVRPPAVPVTIRQLLTHTTGLVDYAATPNYRAGEPLTPLGAVNLSTDQPQMTAPGSTVHYANSNFLYLQLILEHVTGRTYASLVGDLTAQLGLTETAVEPPDHNGWAAGASGGIISTVGDLARWGDALFTPGRVLSASSLTQMMTLDDHEIGLGTWPICPCPIDGHGVRHYLAIGHHIVTGGMFFFPASGLTVAVRIDPEGNDDGGLAAALGGRLSNRFARRPS